MNREETWQALPGAPPLTYGQVQIWRVPLEQTPETLARFERCLAPDELARADRFRFASDRRRYVVARAALRTLLGPLLSLDAASVRFHYGAEGKPSLDAAHESNVQFNVAHSHELALVALARGSALGVDLEHWRELEDAQRIAQRFFSTQEVAALRAAPVAQKQALFFRIWTRKEAFIKATGRGLSQPLGAFNVLRADGQSLSCVELDGATTTWRLWDLFPGAHYAGALAWAERGDAALYQFQP
jgi:4'-phosphopantetheinyl transferase